MKFADSVKAWPSPENERKMDECYAPASQWQSKKKNWNSDRRGMQSCNSRRDLRATRWTPSNCLTWGVGPVPLNAVGKYKLFFMGWVHGRWWLFSIYCIDAVRITWSAVRTTTRRSNRLRRCFRFRHRSRRACRSWPASKTFETGGSIEPIFGSRWDNSPSMGCRGVPRASVCRPGLLVFQKSPSN